MSQLRDPPFRRAGDRAGVFISQCAVRGLDDNLRAFADLPESLKHLGPDRLLTRVARARSRDLHLIWLFPRCIVGPEAGGGAEELDTLLRLLGPPSERQRSDIRRATDIVLIESGAIFYWPRTGEQFLIRDAAYAMARVQATLA